MRAPQHSDWPGRVTVRPRTGLTSPASRRELAYALIDLAVAIFGLSGLLMLLAAPHVLRAFVNADRVLIGSLLGCR